ncbi:MAG: hypothetical protein SPJ84_02660 [Fusobacterium gastrosuis]|uniref:hypothetical protein n=1 Tax=Fusobacterium TaxID=848 RepID=UPI0025BF656A|nr:hypothetical protein [Fusobacterium sp.]MCI7224318.1 hypothetical protein [Fusobacterium sp.]MDY5794706.1 hypothetical protein [Fusobacterium gastrosuis]
MIRNRKYNCITIKKKILSGGKITRGMFEYIQRNPDEFKDLVFVRRKFRKVKGV